MIASTGAGTIAGPHVNERMGLQHIPSHWLQILRAI